MASALLGQEEALPGFPLFSAPRVISGSALSSGSLLSFLVLPSLSSVCFPVCLSILSQQQHLCSHICTVPRASVQGECSQGERVSSSSPIPSLQGASLQRAPGCTGLGLSPSLHFNVSNRKPFLKPWKSLPESSLTEVLSPFTFLLVSLPQHLGYKPQSTAIAWPSATPTLTRRAGTLPSTCPEAQNSVEKRVKTRWMQASAFAIS